jgi:hypothetical protein
MSTEADIQKLAGVPQPGANEKVRPKTEDLEVLSLNGVSYALRAVQYWDKDENKFSEPQITYRQQFRDKTDTYVNVPTPKNIDEVQALIDHYTNLKKIMIGTKIDFEKAAFVSSNTDDAIKKINAIKKK